MKGGEKIVVKRRANKLDILRDRRRGSNPFDLEVLGTRKGGEEGEDSWLKGETVPVGEKTLALRRRKRGDADNRLMRIPKT